MKVINDWLTPTIQKFLILATAFGLLVGLANYWLDASTAPIRQDHALIKAEVQAHEDAQEVTEARLFQDLTEIKENVEYIRRLLER